jgi:hypothetical protein
VSNPGGGEIFCARSDWPWGISGPLFDGEWEGGMCAGINFLSQQCFKCLFEHLKHQSSVGLNPSLRYRFTVIRMQRFRNAVTTLHWPLPSIISAQFSQSPSADFFIKILNTFLI